MKNFTYYRPTSAEQAVGLLDNKWGKTELLGGGTDLLDLTKEYVAQPDKVISLSALPNSYRQMVVLERFPPVYVLGGGMTITDIASNKDLAKWFPALTTAARELGTPQIRNMGTLAGNLFQRPRCWYFRDEHVNCWLKGGDKCFALDGENRYHAIFTKGHNCVIVHPSTLAPALVALGATVEVMSHRGKRTIEVARLFQSPDWKTRETTLTPDEMLLTVTLPAVKDLRSASYEVRHKISYDWPLAHAVVAFKLEAGKARDVKVVLGHVAPTPHIATAAARALEGKEVTEATATAAGEAATEGAKPLSQNSYKLKLTAVAVKRAILTAAGAKKYWEL